MKILWFANTSGLAEAEAGQSGGWIKSLQNELLLQENIELGFVYFTKKNVKPFIHSNTHYFPIYKPSLSFFNKIRLIFGISLKYNMLINECLKIVNQFKPDIIHIHGTENPFGLIAKQIKVPIVISIQGILNEIIKHYYNGFSIKDLLYHLPLRDLINSKGFILAGQAMKSNAKIEKKIFKLNSRYIGRTSWDKLKIKNYAPKCVYYKVNEILRDTFYFVTKNETNKNINQIISIINPTLYKGLDIIFQAAHYLITNYKFNFRWKVVGVSEGDPIVKLAERKFNLVAKNINVEFMGKLNEEELKREMLNSTLFVHPSYIENSSNSIGEAQLLNMNIIASNCGGNPDMIDGYEKGSLYESSYYKILSKLITEHYKGSLSREHAKLSDVAHLRHNKKKNVTDLLKVYNEIINYS